MTDAPLSTANSGPTINSPIVTEENPQQPNALPVVETNPPAPVAETPPLDPNAPDPTKHEVVQKRINEITAKRYEAERKFDIEKEARLAAEAKNADLLKQLAQKTPDTNKSTPTAVDQPKLTEDEIDRRAQEKANNIARVNEFNKECNKIFQNGKDVYKDSWDQSLKNLAMVGAIGQNAPLDFLQTAIELKEPHKVLEHLGKNFEEAERIIKLPPQRMAIELARIESQLHAPQSPIVISNAPTPLIPVNGAATPPAMDISDPNLPMEQYLNLRAQQQEQKKKRYLR